MLRADRWLSGVLLAGMLVACVTNHAQLEKKPIAGHGGTSAGGSSGVSGGHAQLGGTGGEAANGGGHPDDEPPGTSLLTIVNGVVDAPSVVLCLAKVGADGTATPFGNPVGEQPLGYAQRLLLPELAGVDLDADTLQLFLIAGELELIAGLDCEAALALARAEEFAAAGPLVEVPQGGAAGSGAGGAASLVAAEGGVAGDGGSSPGAAGAPPSAVRSRLRARGLPAIVAGTLSAGRSLLMVANGCMGGTAFGGAHAEEYCGVGYAETEPTVSALLVNLSRVVAFDHAGMQVVNASLANDLIDVRSRPPFPSKDAGLSIVSNVVEGQAAPRPATLINAAFDYGSTRLFRLEVSSRGTALFSEPWADVLARGGIAALANEHTYALVLSGPQGDLKAIPDLWNPPALTAIAVDPE